MDYISAQEAANLWGITKRRVQILCASDRIDGAVRIGNMWILPATADKPADKRVKERRSTPQVLRDNPIRAARRRIRAITSGSIGLLMDTGIPCEEAKNNLISLFASELLLHYIREAGGSIDEGAGDAVVTRITGCKAFCWDRLEETRCSIRSFIDQFSFCCDDALSWCYQYANKLDPNALYSGTQFFTEKYMITTIVDAIDISSRRKVFDPACGGGNFLLYCLDVLFDDAETVRVEKDEMTLRLRALLSRLIGYEIDPELAIVASLNLRLKCLSILAERKIHIVPGDLLSFAPDIYYPVHTTVGGALDLWAQEQEIVKVGSSAPADKRQILSGIDAVVTNPPFQTIKGMPDALKQFLKKSYPESKCDMCNAFLVLSRTLLSGGGVAGLVTQNSWMYLDSFLSLRQDLLETCAFQEIWELGSNAFYDLNGEKSNVALVTFQKSLPRNDTKIRMISLKSMETASVEAMLSSRGTGHQYERFIFQKDVLQNSGVRFDMISSVGLREHLMTACRYEQFAVPMQGTSTGNAKELIDYFWRHIGDKDWALVSKGGGYCRWLGLNHYCVKWGKDGEFIKKTKGSAIRNAAYFGETQMVFSDTGTAGLNVRQLLPGQIFVASGPGIRIQRGKPFAHLAFLNSRFASYYIRLLSPKLTIAAGYIGKLPVCSEILTSDILDECARRCVDAKQRRLSKRVNNIEFYYRTPFLGETVAAAACRWFLEDVEDEWTQLQAEEKIDRYIFSAMSLSEEDVRIIDQNIGTKSVYASALGERIDSLVLAKEAAAVLDHSCCISRTKVDRKSIGCDGLLEYLSQKLKVSCQTIHDYVIKPQFYTSAIQSSYEDLYLHALVMSALAYKDAPHSLADGDVLRRVNIQNREDRDRMRAWIDTRFNTVHCGAMMRAPIFTYDPGNAMFISREDSEE